MPLSKCIPRIIDSKYLFPIKNSPAIKKSVGAFENQIQELAYEEQSYKNSIANSEKEFASYCEKIGIAGENIQKEVPALIKHLPEIFDKFVGLIQTPLMREILEYYYGFTRYVNPKQNEQVLICD